MTCDGKCSSSYHGAEANCLKTGSQTQLGPHASLQSGVAITTPTAAPIHPNKPIVFVKCRRFILYSLSSPPNDQRPPPETPGRLQESQTNYPNRPTAQRGGAPQQYTLYC